MLDNVHTIAQGFDTKATNKLISISGRFFETLRRKIINRKNLAVQNQMRSIENLINEKLSKLPSVQEMPKNKDVIQEDQESEILEENTSDLIEDNEPKLEENTSELVEDNNEQEFVIQVNEPPETTEENTTTTDLIEDNNSKLDENESKVENKSDLIEENETEFNEENQDLIIKETEELVIEEEEKEEEELVIDENELIIENEPPKIVEKSKIVIKEETDTEDEFQLNNNRKMMEKINEKPIKFINYLEGAIRSDINQKTNQKKLNDFIEVLFQLFPGSAFEEFIQQLIPLVIKEEGDTFQTLIDFCKELTPNSGVLKYINKLATNLFTFKNSVLDFFEPNKKIGFFQKGGLILALGKKVVNFVLENKDSFKTDLYDQVKEESNLKRAMDNFSLMINILKSQTSKKEAVPAIQNAILSIVIFTLEAINENNSKK